MATNVTPIANPAGGFPMKLSAPSDRGAVATTTFPSSAAKDLTRTNLCTNPKFGTGATTNWTNTSLTTFAAGAFPVSLNLGQPVANGLHIVGDAAGDMATFAGWAVTSGAVYAASLIMYVVSQTASIAIGFRDDAGVAIGTDTTVTLVPGQAYGVSKLMTAAASGTNTKFDVKQVGAGAVDLWFTAVLIETAAGVTVESPGGYFDGDTNADTAWTGTANLSTSTHAMTRMAATYKAMRVQDATTALVAPVT